jgi:hypothetical protein
VDKARKSYEHKDIQNTETFFDNLKSTVEELDIGPSEMWNEDECGIRIGCLRERIQVLIVRTTRAQRPEVSDPNNRETTSLLGAGNAVGDTIPPWLIFKAFPTESWLEIDCVPGMRFAKSETGFSNRDIAFEWLHHFNVESWKASAKAQKTGLSLEEWFGCDEWLREPGRPHNIFKQPPNSRPDNERIYRLLIIDGFTGHTAFHFVNYCIMFDIVFCTLPPHSTHILQPLDVGVFQFLKNAHQKALRQSIREGNLAFTRLAFAAAFHEFYYEGFSAAHIMRGFEKSGIYPITSKPAITYIHKKQLKSRTPVEPAYTDLLPKETRFQQAEDSLAAVLDKYGDVMSSPSREKLQSARKVLSESILMDKQRNAFVSNFESRLKKVTSKRKPGKFIKPSGMFVTSVNFEDIKEQHEVELAAAEEKEQRRQLRSVKSLVKQERGRFFELWKADKIARFGTTRKAWKFEDWLKDTGRETDYLSIDTSNSKFNELLNQKPDGFMIDIPESQELRRARQRASKAPRPILAMDFPKSDDTVTFTGLGPFNDEDDEDEDTLVERRDPDDQDDTQFDSLPPFMKSSPPAEVIEVIDPDTPCPRQLPPQVPPPSQPRHRWKTLSETGRVRRANLNNEADQSHNKIGS